MEGASTQRHAVRGFGGSSRLSRDSATTVHRTQLPTPAHAHHATPHDTRTRVKAEVPLVIGYGASGRANAWHGCCPCAHTPRMESASRQRHAVWLHEGKLPTCKCRRRSARRSQRTLACAFSQRGVQEKATARTPYLSCACIALIMFASRAGCRCAPCGARGLHKARRRR